MSNSIYSDEDFYFHFDAQFNVTVLVIEKLFEGNY